MPPPTNTPVVTNHPDGYQVVWPGYQRAFALFSVQGTGAIVTDIFRDSCQPKGSAGQMLADAFRAVGIVRPTRVRLANILSTQPTLTQIDFHWAGPWDCQSLLGTVDLRAESLSSKHPSADDYSVNIPVFSDRSLGSDGAVLITR